MPALRFSANIVHPPLPSAACLNPWNSKPKQRIRYNLKSRAALSSSSSTPGDHDLYDLLGLDSSSNHSQIKSAYRALQKLCHPDIAGPAGHEMAIVLNEAYAILSDSRSRSAYDEERAQKVDFHGFTGKPIYSTWLGPQTEQRAVFVDEVRCVGCLKCALFARNTFAIESVYGRARVVGQWADPESKILDAIETCPVDCISIVARSDLPALEFCMSKQSRGPVRMTDGSSAGNIFSDVKKFQRRYSEMEGRESKESEARTSAVQRIISISYWWLRQNPRRDLVVFAGKRTGSFSNAKRLKEAAEKRRESGATELFSRLPPASRDGEEYWTPLVLPSPPQDSITSRSIQSRQSPKINPDQMKSIHDAPSRSSNINSALFRVPVLVAAIAAGAVQGGGRTVGGGLEQHLAGAPALEIVNSSWLQTLLAGITWYLIAAAAVGVIAVCQRKDD